MEVPILPERTWGDEARRVVTCTALRRIISGLEWRIKLSLEKRVPWMTEFIEFTTSNGVASLTFRRAEKRNALKRDFIAKILDALNQVQQDESVRVFLLKAEGSVFCAGMDLGEMQERATSSDKEQEWQKDSEIYCEMLTKIFTLPVPTVAVLQGPVLAGGVGIVLACDIVLASDQVFFALPEPMRGITAAMVTPFLMHRIGAGPATYMLLHGGRVSSQDAFRFGLIHQMTTQDELEKQCDELTQSILTGSPLALAITKKHIGDCTTADILQQVQASIRVSAQARETDDAREGLAAFLDKRKPNWMSGA